MPLLHKRFERYAPYRTTMLLSKTKTYLLLQAIFVFCIAVVQLFWAFSRTTQGEILEFNRAADRGKWKQVETITVRYWVDYKEYTETYTRNKTPLWQKDIPVRYSILFPGVSRVDSFLSNWGEYMIWYLVYFLATTMLFFVPNEVLPRGTMFRLKPRHPVVTIIRVPSKAHNSGLPQ